MLTCEIRTMDLSKIIELWDTDKELLKDQLLEEYDMLATKYRELTREYNQKMHKQSTISRKYYTPERINYKRELGIGENLFGNIKYTKDLAENIKIAHEYKDSVILFNEAVLAGELKEIVRLKARELHRLLAILGEKVNYIKDFESEVDKWLEYDIN